MNWINEVRRVDSLHRATIVVETDDVPDDHLCAGFLENGRAIILLVDHRAYAEPACER